MFLEHFRRHTNRQRGVKYRLDKLSLEGMHTIIDHFWQQYIRENITHTKTTTLKGSDTLASF